MSLQGVHRHLADSSNWLLLGWALGWGSRGKAERDESGNTKQEDTNWKGDKNTGPRQAGEVSCWSKTENNSVHTGSERTTATGALSLREKDHVVNTFSQIFHGHERVVGYVLHVMAQPRVSVPTSDLIAVILKDIPLLSRHNEAASCLEQSTRSPTLTLCNFPRCSASVPAFLWRGFCFFPSGRHFQPWSLLC